MVALAENHQPIELVTLTEELNKRGELEASGGAPFISSLADGMPRVSNVEHYAQIVREKAILRRTIHTTQEIQESAFRGAASAEVLNHAVETFRDLASTANIRPLAWLDHFKIYEQMEQGDMRFLIKDFLPEGVCFIGALSGSGKTWFALSMAKALTTGQNFLGLSRFQVPEPTSVIYLVPEAGERSFRGRMDKLGVKRMARRPSWTIRYCLRQCAN
jgi:replicative DNA helicase